MLREGKLLVVHVQFSTMEESLSLVSELKCFSNEQFYVRLRSWFCAIKEKASFPQLFSGREGAYFGETAASSWKCTILLDSTLTFSLPRPFREPKVEYLVDSDQSGHETYHLPTRRKYPPRISCLILICECAKNLT